MKTRPLTSPLTTIRVMLMLGVAAILGMLAFSLWQLKDTPLPDRHRDRPNPWRGLPGCLWISGPDGPRLWPVTSADELACAEKIGERAAVVEPAARPTHAKALIDTIYPWLAAPAHAKPGLKALPGDLPAKSVPLPARIGGHTVLQGAHIFLTIDPLAQATGQKIVECMTGLQSILCDALSIPPDRWAHHYEGAAARMAALVQVNIADSAIEVLASAHSPCFAADAAAAPARPDCPKLAHTPRRPELWRLDNHALHSTANPGSENKPVLSVSLLRSDLGQALLRPGPQQERFLTTLQTSDTPVFLDNLYCKDHQFSGCTRAALVPQVAHDLGFDGRPLPLLLGTGSDLVVVGARMAQVPERDAGSRMGWKPMAFEPTSPSQREACSQRKWSQCDGELANQTSELWGAGNALATPVGLAAMLTRLGAAANGSTTVNPIHLASKIKTGSGDILPAVAEPVAIDPEHARLVLRGMAKTHTASGTAHSACLAVYGDAMTCNRITWLSGKTGTPGFLHDRLTLAERNRLCEHTRAEHDAALAQRKSLASPVKADFVRCTLAPMKWYAALVKDADGKYSKVIVVLTERNWNRETGRVDSVGDKGTPNIAAELAMRYLRARGYKQPVQENRNE